jgi:hypothetical protein
VLIRVELGLIVTDPRTWAKRPVPPVTGILIRGVAIEIERPPASTFPPGRVVIVAKSAVATHRFENAVHCLRIV